MFLTNIKDESLGVALDWLIQDDTDHTLFITILLQNLTIFREGKILNIIVPYKSEIPSILIDFLQKPEYKYITYPESLFNIVQLENTNNYYDYRILLFKQYQLELNEHNKSIYANQRFNKKILHSKFGKASNLTYFSIANECIYTCLSYKNALEYHPLTFEIYKKYMEYQDLIKQDKQRSSKQSPETPTELKEEVDNENQ